MSTAAGADRAEVTIDSMGCAFKMFTLAAGIATIALIALLIVTGVAIELGLLALATPG